MKNEMDHFPGVSNENVSMLPPLRYFKSSVHTAKIYRYQATNQSIDGQF